MNKIVKLVFGLALTIVTYTSAMAQSDSAAAKDEAIVCRQISDNVFDCYVKQGNTDQEKNLDNSKKNRYNKDNKIDTKEEMKPYQKDSESEEAPENFNRSDVIQRDRDIEGLDFSKETPPMKDPSSPMDRKNEDNIHMPGDETQDNNMYELYRDKQERELINDVDDETFYQKKRDSLGIEA